MHDNTKNDVIARMRDLAKDPSKLHEMTVGWNQVCDKLYDHYLTMRPKPKSFEVHHMNETARYRFACAVVAGISMEECIDIAISKIVGI